MTATSNKTIKTLRDKLEDLLASCADSVPVAFFQAMQAFMTAMDYKDATLMRSHVETALDSLVGPITSDIQTRLNASQAMRESYSDAISKIEGEPIEPDESLDDLGRKLDSMLAQVLSHLTECHPLVLKLAEHNHPIPNAVQLGNEIAALRAFRVSVHDTWPWTHRIAPPAPVQMAFDVTEDEAAAIEQVLAGPHGAVGKINFDTSRIPPAPASALR